MINHAFSLLAQDLPVTMPITYKVIDREVLSFRNIFVSSEDDAKLALILVGCSRFSSYLDEVNAGLVTYENYELSTSSDLTNSVHELLSDGNLMNFLYSNSSAELRANFDKSFTTLDKASALICCYLYIADKRSR